MNNDKLFSDIATRIWEKAVAGVPSWERAWSEAPSPRHALSRLFPVRERMTFPPNAAAEALLKASGARVAVTQAETPAYDPQIDTVELLEPSRFDSAGAYYASVFHELGHWTARRVGRRTHRGFGPTFLDYAREELVAEFTAAFVCGVLGIDRIADHAAYVVHFCNEGGLSFDDVQVAVDKAADAADFILAKAAAAAEPLKIAA